MDFGRMFLLNLGMLITVAYMATVLYKHIFHYYISPRSNYILSVVLFILSGWVSMKFALRLNEEILFDLRFVPLIIATVVYAQPLTIIIIGLGIGLSRFTFGFDEAAIVGFVNMAFMGLLCAGLNIWLRNKGFNVTWRGVITILVVNIMYTFIRSFIGLIPFSTYMTTMAPITLPLSVLLSFVFAFILRDFQLERRQTLELKYANDLLRKQAEELHRTKMVLEERATQLAQASQYKSEFLANLSHELRTPLNGIINLAQIISENEEQDEEDGPGFGKMIYKSGQDLLQIINDILDLSKVEAGRLEIVHEETSLSDLLQILQIHCDHTAEKKGIEFNMRIEEGMPDMIYSDPHRIGQILRNLLSNAFKFTHEGSITLDIRRERSSDGSTYGWIVFRVVDTGIGIPEDKLEAVFEPFQQADGSISRKYGGTGLGLSISRDLSRLLGGYIRLQSVEGQGSVFSLFVPLVVPSDHEEADSKKTDQSVALG